MRTGWLYAARHVRHLPLSSGSLAVLRCLTPLLAGLLLVAGCSGPQVGGSVAIDPAEALDMITDGTEIARTSWEGIPPNDGSSSEGTKGEEGDPVGAVAGLPEGVRYVMPAGLNRVDVIEALGGRLQEDRPPVYPPFYVGECWDVYQGVYVLYVTDTEAVDPAGLEPYLHGAPLRLIVSGYPIGALEIWWNQIFDGLKRDAIKADASMTPVDPGFPDSGQFCSLTGYYFDIALFPESHDADLTDLLSGIPAELIRLTYYDVDPPLFPAGDESP